MKKESKWYYAGKVVCRPVFSQDEIRQLVKLIEDNNFDKVTSDLYRKLIHYYNLTIERSMTIGK